MPERQTTTSPLLPCLLHAARCMQPDRRCGVEVVVDNLILPLQIPC